MVGSRGIPVQDAVARVSRAFAPLPPITLPLPEAHGRVLAEDVIARADNPYGDDAAVDGIACRLADTLVASSASPVRLRRVGVVPAGLPFDREVGPGECVEIYTGGLMPAGTDALVPVERLRLDGDDVWLRQPASPRDVRPRGQALRAGLVALPAGARLDALALALVASAGHDRVSVRRTPRLAILATGDELVAPGSAGLASGASYESNTFGLAALAREAHAEVVELGRTGDEPDALRQRLDTCAAAADLIVTSGGVSLGGRDEVRRTLEEHGEVLFWRVAMKPGGPTLFGRWQGTPLLGLPGNPVASLVVFWLLGLPALRALEGASAPVPLERPWPARAGRGLLGVAGRVHFARVRLLRQGDQLVAEPVSTQSSGVMRSLTEADALAVLPPDSSPQPGDPIEVFPWSRPLGR